MTAIASNDVWAVGYNLGFHASIALHWNGSQWQLVPSSPTSFGPDYQMFDVSAVASNDVWAVGYIEFSGSTDDSSPSAHRRTIARLGLIDGLWNSNEEEGTTDLFITHWNGSNWTQVPVTNPGNYRSQLYGVAAVSANDVWAVGHYSTNSGETYAPLFLRWNGTQWVHVVGEDPPTYNSLREIAVASPSDIWAVGIHADCALCIFADTLIMHWDGAQWRRVPSPNGVREISGLNGVAAVSETEVWSVGTTSDYTTIERFSDVITQRHLCDTLSPDYQVTVSAAATMVPTNNYVPGSGCSNCTVNIPLPFAYVLYGLIFRTVNVSSEGNLQFASNSTLAQNTCLPNPALNYAILPYWDNLDSNIDDTMGAYTATIGTAPNRIFAIRWYGGREAADSVFNYQVLLYEGQPRFDIIYGTTHERGFSATIGVQRDTGQNFTQFSCNTQSIQAGTKLIFDRRTNPELRY